MTSTVRVNFCNLCEKLGATNVIHVVLQHLIAYKCYQLNALTLKVLVTTIDAQWEGMGDVGSARYEPALLPPCPTIRVLSYSN